MRLKEQRLVLVEKLISWACLGWEGRETGLEGWPRPCAPAACAWRSEPSTLGAAAAVVAWAAAWAARPAAAAAVAVIAATPATAV